MAALWRRCGGSGSSSGSSGGSAGGCGGCTVLYVITLVSGPVIASHGCHEHTLTATQVQRFHEQRLPAGENHRLEWFHAAELDISAGT